MAYLVLFRFTHPVSDAYTLWYSLSHGMSIFQEGKGGKDTIKLEASAESSKVSLRLDKRYLLRKCSKNVNIDKVNSSFSHQ